MTSYQSLDRHGLETEFAEVSRSYDALKKLDLHLDMSRGKPSAQQLDLSNDLFEQIGAEDCYKNRDGVECRNYGVMDGIGEMKALFGEILGMPPEQVIVGGNSSLTMMFDTIAQAMTHGTGGEPWMKQKDIAFLCPVPGYDRHFAITEHFGIRMIPVKNTPDGPDMDAVEGLVKDPRVKGMWCVPKYSNPQGITYSDETVRRIAALRPAAEDFRVMWDNAYAIHDLYEPGDALLNLYDECVKAGNPDLAFIFTSTSKISFPGAGVAAQAASPANIEWVKSRLKFQSIGPDKLNQLRHARRFPDLAAVKEQMRRQADCLRPKFDTVLETMERELSGLEIARWHKPNGGYFISLDVMNGCAKRVGELCAGVGMILTKVGATWPYGVDPEDSNIRIAPSFPPVEEIGSAAQVLCIAVKYAALEKLLQQFG